MKAVICLTILFFFISCDSNKSSKGFFDRIVVFSDIDNWNQLEEDIKETLAEPWSVPSIEEKYRIEHHDFKDFDIYKNQRNLLYIVSEDKKNMLSKFVEEFFSKEAKEAYRNGKHHFFHIKNVYAEDQSVLIFVVKNSDNIRQVYRDSFHESPVIEEFYKYNKERISKLVYSYSEQDDIEEKMRKDFGYSFRVPYKFNVEDYNFKADSNIYSMYKRVPFSWAWVKTFYNRKHSITEINREMLHHLRDSLMKVHFDSEETDKFIEMEEYPVMVSGLPGIRYQGSYILNKDSLLAGGPFITYILTDTINEKLFFLDANLFNLGKRKSRDLQNLDEVLKTFNINKKDG